MKTSVSIKGRPKKGDMRSLHVWCDEMHMRAECEEEAFVLAALYRMLIRGECTKAFSKEIERKVNAVKKEYFNKMKNSN